MSFKPYTEKIKEKKIGICSILGRIRIHHPESGSADPDPHQNDTDPKHCCQQFFFFPFYISSKDSRNHPPRMPKSALPYLRRV